MAKMKRPSQASTPVTPRYRTQVFGVEQVDPEAVRAGSAPTSLGPGLSDLFSGLQKGWENQQDKDKEELPLIQEEMNAGRVEAMGAISTAALHGPDWDAKALHSAISSAVLGPIESLVNDPGASPTARRAAKRQLELAKLGIDSASTVTVRSLFLQRAALVSDTFTQSLVTGADGELRRAPLAQQELVDFMGPLIGAYAQTLELDHEGPGAEKFMTDVRAATDGAIDSWTEHANSTLQGAVLNYKLLLGDYVPLPTNLVEEPPSAAEVTGVGTLVGPRRTISYMEMFSGEDGLGLSEGDARALVARITGVTTGLMANEGHPLAVMLQDLSKTAVEALGSLKADDAGNLVPNYSALTAVQSDIDECLRLMERGGETPLFSPELATAFTQAQGMLKNVRVQMDHTAKWVNTPTGQVPAGARGLIAQAENNANTAAALRGILDQKYMAVIETKFNLGKFDQARDDMVNIVLGMNSGTGYPNAAALFIEHHVLRSLDNQDSDYSPFRKVWLPVIDAMTDQRGQGAKAVPKSATGQARVQAGIDVGIINESVFSDPLLKRIYKYYRLAKAQRPADQTPLDRWKQAYARAIKERANR